tara:strand:- start:4603 stop:5016 length:414 start_codon:yes stop_codon:yes gene_type:complete
MKKSELVKLIREAVKAELNESLPRLISENIKQIGQPPASSDPVELTKNILEKNLVKEETKSTPTKRFSKNEVLNKILNETVGGIPSEAPKVGDSQTVTDLQGNSVDVDELPDHLSRALTRNYSDVVKLVDKKRGKIS